MKTYRVDMPISMNSGLLNINIVHFIRENTDEEGLFIEDRILLNLKNGDYFMLSTRTERVDNPGSLNDTVAKRVAIDGTQALMYGFPPTELVNYYYANKQDFADAGALDWYYTEAELL